MRKNRKLVGLMAAIMLLLIGAFAFAETGRKYVEGVPLTTIIMTKTFSAAQQCYELLKDTDLAGRRYVIDSIIFSSSSANYLYVNDTATTNDCGYGYYRVPANGTIIDRDIILKLDAAAGLYVSNTAAGEVCIEYHFE